MGVIESAVDTIKQMIIDGELRPGQKLPVEKDLAEQLGVARNTLREAVRALIAMRVLQTRQGDGTYVTSLSPGLLLDGMSFVADLHQDAGAGEFLHVRRILEPEATALAAARIPDADLAVLGDLLDEAERLAADSAVDHGKLVALDQDFHSLIVSHCGNAVLAAVIQNMSGRTVRARIWRGMTDPEAVQRTLREHRAVYRALRARDAERARLHAALHVLGVEESLSPPSEDAGGE
ncbi:FadR/GntR family transcriptional regulator [Microbispora sp. ATCC PTA-5024]|uniref:FadR/GntR family transcriptional regulator n=1 Tax=Microbispora sp. ATCC PTA-5024 TaxID=316330 RepID=UPI0003DC1CDF|nr:FadR/GntR family transcriptional regulator [Microbispora sp. ATCC PTA-5024]ETK36913.1 GntR family transcriptional regulator [Microbispora sp. ATCC PTA-5024]